MRRALAVFVSRDAAVARDLVAEKDRLREEEARATERHFARLRDGLPETIETSALHLDVLRDLKRINAHLTTVAYPILEQTGELRGSRLRAAGRSRGTARRRAPTRERRARPGNVQADCSGPVHASAAPPARIAQAERDAAGGVQHHQRRPEPVVAEGAAAAPPPPAA